MAKKFLTISLALIMATGFAVAWDTKWDSNPESDWDIEWNDDWKDFESDWKKNSDFESDMKFESIDFDWDDDKKSSEKAKKEDKTKDSKKKEKNQEPVYWQVDFGEGEVPIPPTYAPNDLMAALGNSSGVRENPSLLRQKTAGQLGDVEIKNSQFEFDNPDNPTEATVSFTVEEGAENRTLHLASFELPGPYDYDEIDQQVLYDSEVRTFQGGESGEMTVELPE